MTLQYVVPLDPKTPQPLRYQHAMEALELVSVTQTHSRKAMLQAVQDAAWRHTFSPSPARNPWFCWGMKPHLWDHMKVS